MHGSKLPWPAVPPRTAARARERRVNFIARRRIGWAEGDGISVQTSELDESWIEGSV